jgi:hypothetical protein
MFHVLIHRHFRYLSNHLLRILFLGSYLDRELIMFHVLNR